MYMLLRFSMHVRWPEKYDQPHHTRFALQVNIPKYTLRDASMKQRVPPNIVAIVGLGLVRKNFESLGVWLQYISGTGNSIQT